MKTIKKSELSKIKMSVNPPELVKKSGFRVIHNKKVLCWVGIGWVVENEATKSDFENIPVVID